MKLGLSLNEDIPVARHLELARTAEAGGFDSIWANDALGRDPFVLCQAWASATSRIRLGIGIAQLLTRTAAQYAKAAATLQESSGGRFLLGVGVSRPAAMRWHGIEMTGKPLTATREMLELVAAITRGETTDYDGAVLSSHGFRLGMSPLPTPVPLYLGAMRPKALALAGTHADGVLLSWEGPDACAAATAKVRKAAVAAERPAPEIAAYVRVAVAPEREQARLALARSIAYYWQWYAEHFCGQVPADAATAARAAYERGGVEALVNALDDEILRELGWYGTPDDDLAPLFATFGDAGVEHFVVRAVPVGDPVDWMQLLLRTLG